MPIRFRCAYCQQLMGIARRKAGTVVTCPKCAGQVVVPKPEEDEPQEPAGPRAGPRGADAADNGGLFEESDFEKVFEGGQPQVLHQPTIPPKPIAKPNPLPAPMPVPRMAELDYDAVPLDPTGVPARGIYLTPTFLALLCGMVVVLTGMAFFLGLLLGRSG